MSTIYFKNNTNLYIFSKTFAFFLVLTAYSFVYGLKDLVIIDLFGLQDIVQQTTTTEMVPDS